MTDPEGQSLTADPCADFRQQLLDQGLLVATGTLGLYGRSGAFEDILQAVDRLVVSAGVDQDATIIHFPPVLPRSVFEKTDYLRSFPNLTGSIHTFDGNDRDHAALLAVLESGGDWTKALVPTEVVLCSAACHPLYPTITGRLPSGGRRFNVGGFCFRHEPSLDPARMQSFRQHEFVYVGEADGAQAHRDLWVERGSELLAGLGLEVETVVANDPFFGRLGRMLATNQRDEVLKYEVVAQICNTEPTAVMSANCHRDHFGVPFAIETADGTPAHSACVGFGMERITLALLHAHGLSVESWPASVRGRLFP
jgi:seryl-tRNA synthetase